MLDKRRELIHWVCQNAMNVHWLVKIPPRKVWSSNEQVQLLVFRTARDRHVAPGYVPTHRLLQHARTVTAFTQRVELRSFGQYILVERQVYHIYKHNLQNHILTRRFSKTPEHFHLVTWVQTVLNLQHNVPQDPWQFGLGLFDLFKS